MSEVSMWPLRRSLLMPGDGCRLDLPCQCLTNRPQHAGMQLRLRARDGVQARYGKAGTNTTDGLPASGMRVYGTTLDRLVAALDDALKT